LRETDRSATAVTAEVIVAVLFAGLGSVSWLTTLAVSVTEGAALIVVFTTIVTVAVELAAIVPIAAVTTPDACVGAEPCVEVDETYVTPAGSVSVTTTPRAEVGPLLMTVSVYVRFCPTWTCAGDDWMETETSAVPLAATPPEKGEVFPTGSVAVAVINWPAPTGGRESDVDRRGAGGVGRYDHGAEERLTLQEPGGMGGGVGEELDCVECVG
jgi:hypothetical protein